MVNISQKELFSINEIVARHQIIASKLCDYADNCTDPEVKQMFKSASTEANKSIQNLVDML